MSFLSPGGIQFNVINAGILAAVGSGFKAWPGRFIIEAAASISIADMIRAGSFHVQDAN
jgi:hypothetical protein